MRATAALAAVTICGPFVAMSAQSGENLCDHLRAFERAPMETAENGKPGRRWVELHWIGGWTDFTTGWHMECRDSGAMASKALCAWLSNNTTFEFSNGVPMTFLECYTYRRPQVFAEWYPLFGATHVWGKEDDRFMTLEADFRERKAVHLAMRWSVVPLGFNQESYKPGPMISNADNPLLDN